MMKYRSQKIQILIGITTVSLLMNLNPAFGQEVKWFKIGDLHNWFRADGCEPEVGRTNLQADQQDGMRWPAQFHGNPGPPDTQVDNIAARALWIGATNYTDAEQYGGVTYPHKVVHIGPRGWDTQREFMPIEFKMIGKFDHPQVFVDGLPGSDLMFNDVVDEVDPDLPVDRMIYNVINTSIGITMTRRIFGFAHPDHNDYYITEYIFKNTGNVDPDPEIEQSKTLENVHFFFQYRYAVSREGAAMTDLNSPRWGINAMLSTRGEAKESDGSQYTGDYEDWLNGDPDADSMRCQFSWMGRHSQAPVDLIGAPDFRRGTGRFMAPQFIGVVTLHADTSPTDNSDDPQQPITTTFQQSDDPETRPNDQFDPSRMSDEWKWITRGHRLPRHDELVGDDGFPDQLEGTPGGFSNMNGYGPYTLAPGDSIRIVVAEGVNGLDRKTCEVLGRQWIEEASPYTLPDGSSSTDRNEFKNTWIMTGRDSLFKIFGLARRNFENNFEIPQPPPPPEFFEINSGGDRINLSWSNNAETWPGFAGYRIFRAVAKPDTFFTELFACGQGTDHPEIVNEYDDTSATRGFSYYYYIVSFDDGSNSNGRVLQSSLFWTRTQEPAFLRRPAGESITDFRVVPNPFHIRAGARNLQFPGEPDKITFLNIPGQCTIKIFTERGDLIRTIEHSDGSGDESWNSTTEFGQIVVSGIYIVVVETPDGQRGIQKFMVIR